MLVYDDIFQPPKKSSPAGNRTPVSRVTGGDTYHYTTEDTYITMYVFIKTVKSCNRKQEYKQLHILSETVTLYEGIGGSVVEFSPATRVTRVRFPADALFGFTRFPLYIMSFIHFAVIPAHAHMCCSEGVTRKSSRINSRASSKKHKSYHF